MDVIPIVGKEIATRFHRRETGSPGEDDGGKSAAAVAAVTEELTSLLMRLWLLGSENTDPAGNVGESAERIEELAEGVVGYLYGSHMPNLATVLLQSETYALRASLAKRRRTEEVKAEAIGLRLVDAIVEKTATATADDILGDIVLYILHRYGQLQASPMGGGEAGLATHKETATVLCSVLPRPQALSFARQDMMEKQRQLEELRRIVWGIRIFYKEEGKMAGVGLVELQEMVEQPLAAMEEALGHQLTRVEDDLLRSRAVIESPSCPLSEHEVTLLREEYHHLCQQQANLLTVRCLHQTLSQRIHTTVIPNYHAILTELRDIFQRSSDDASSHHNATNASAIHDTAFGGTGTGAGGGKPRSEAVRKRIAYPLFMQLADVYSLAARTVSELEDADALLALTAKSAESYASSIPAKLAEEATAHDVLPPPAVQLDDAALSEMVREAVSQDETVAALGLRISHVPEPPLGSMDPVVAECYPASFLAFRGYCPVTFVESHLLVPGRSAGRAADESCPGFLLIEGGSGPRWKLPRHLYVTFRDEPALRRFAANPLRYMDACMWSCNRREPAPTLIMGMLDRLPRELYIAGSRIVEAPVSWVDDSDAPTKADAGTQTGQIDPYLDHNYRWNEWDLRRQALKLANLLNMRTHSTQTAASHFRRDGATQATPPKEGGTQTMQDAATQPDHIIQYLKGLRGTESSEVEQVQRTIPY